mmetsp:Transcript_40720/g.91573  ORF Transcript_40720/g.91573 Transcript_40720/m.91573 type:complete len:204 (-) Transcript_40720:1215-1826(-)
MEIIAARFQHNSEARGQNTFVLGGVMRFETAVETKKKKTMNKSTKGHTAVPVVQRRRRICPKCQPCQSAVRARANNAVLSCPWRPRRRLERRRRRRRGRRPPPSVRPRTVAPRGREKEVQALPPRVAPPETRLPPSPLASCPLPLRPPPRALPRAFLPATPPVSCPLGAPLGAQPPRGLSCRHARPKRIAPHLSSPSSSSLQR